MRSGRRKVIAAQYPHRAVTPIRDIDAVSKRDIGDALRLAHPGDRAQQLTGRQIDHPQAVVAELGDKQPLSLQIDAQMINPAADLTQRDLCLQHKRRTGRLRYRGGGRH